MGYIYADVKVGGRFDIGIDGAVSNPRFIVHRRMVDEKDGTDMPDNGVREVEVPAGPADFDALFGTTVAQLAADNQARHEQVAALITDAADAVKRRDQAVAQHLRALDDAIMMENERDAALAEVRALKAARAAAPDAKAEA